MTPREVLLLNLLKDCHKALSQPRNFNTHLPSGDGKFNLRSYTLLSVQEKLVKEIEAGNL